MRRKKLFIFSLLLLFRPEFSLPPRINLLYLYLNKPGVKVKEPNPRRLLKLTRAYHLHELNFAESDGVKILRIKKALIQKIWRISTSVDLSPYFKNKNCIKNWEIFHQCLSQRLNPEDEKLYQKLDRFFYSKLICQSSCPDPTFPLWEVHWYAPAFITISASIGQKGFKNITEAKKSLSRINSLLKEVIYGARFPENYGEGKTPYEVFVLETTPEKIYDFSQTLKEILLQLIKEKFIEGLSEEDLQKICQLGKGGNLILFIPKECRLKEKNGKDWVSFPNSVRISFDKRKCPKIEIIRRRSP